MSSPTRGPAHHLHMSAPDTDPITSHTAGLDAGLDSEFVAVVPLATLVANTSTVLAAVAAASARAIAAMDDTDTTCNDTTCNDTGDTSSARILLHPTHRDFVARTLTPKR